MQMKVRRELGKSTLAALIDAPEKSLRYQYRMLKDNDIPGLLRCDYHYVDGELLAVYDITGLESLPEFRAGRDIPGEEIYWIFQTILETFERMGEFLLGGEDLVLVPEYVFLDSERKQTALCCIPGRGTDVFRELQSFTEYFLRRACHDDREGIMMIYELYRITSQEQYDLGQLKKTLEQGNRVKREPKKRSFGEPLHRGDLRKEESWGDEDMLYIDLSDTETEDISPEPPKNDAPAAEKPRAKKGAAFRKGGMAVSILLIAAAVVWLAMEGAFYGENGLKLGAGFLMASAVTAYVIWRGSTKPDKENKDQLLEVYGYEKKEE